MIVGLGNPGAEYARTRHNAGFRLVNRLAEKWRANWAHNRKFCADIARADCGERRVWLCKPQTYMNSSGDAVGALTLFYRVPAARMLVAVDDADLPLGELRLRARGSSGGHHGLESIESRLGTRDFARLRMGIGREKGAREISDFVLGRFAPGEAELAETMIETGCRQAECWLLEGIERAMSQFNGAVGGPESERKNQ